MGSARASRAVFRAPAENSERTGKFRTFRKRRGAKRLDARRVQRHPGRVWSPTSVSGLITKHESKNKDSDSGTVAQAGCLVARGKLPLSRTDLSLRQSAAEKAAQAGAHQTAPARPLGHDAGIELHLRPPEPRHQGTRPECHQYHRAGPRRTRV